MRKLVTLLDKSFCENDLTKSFQRVAAATDAFLWIKVKEHSQPVLVNRHLTKKETVLENEALMKRLDFDRQRHKNK